MLDADNGESIGFLFLVMDFVCVVIGDLEVGNLYKRLSHEFNKLLGSHEQGSTFYLKGVLT